MAFLVNGLDETQLGILQKNGKCFTDADFYLAGGTALTIYLGHRRSVDFDWFTPSNIPDPMQLAQSLRDAGLEFKTENVGTGTLYGSLANIRMSFIEYHYPLLEPLQLWEDCNCNLASLDDLACMKLAAVAQRGLRKDLIDVYSLIKEYKPLPKLLSLFMRKYQTDNVIPVLMGLVYFKNAESEPDPLLWSVSWSEVKKSLAAWVKQIG